MAEPVQRAYKYRFYPTAEQRVKLDKYFGHTRWVWNHSLEFRTKAYRRRGESVTGVDYSRLLTRLKRTTRYDWLKEVPASAYSQKLRDQDRAFRNLFEGRARHPRRRKRRMAQSVRLQMDQRGVRKNFDANDQRLVIQGLGQVKLRWSHRPYCPDCTNAPDCPACPKPKMVTVRRDSAGRYFVSFSVEESRREHAPAPLPIVAVDLGLTDFLTDSAAQHGEAVSGAGSAAHPDASRPADVIPPQTQIRTLARATPTSRTVARTGGRREGQFPAPRISETGEREPSHRYRDAERAGDDPKPTTRASDRDDGLVGVGAPDRHKAEWAGRDHIAVDQWFPSTERSRRVPRDPRGPHVGRQAMALEACGAYP